MKSIQFPRAATAVFVCAVSFCAIFFFGCNRQPLEHGTSFVLGVATNVTVTNPEQALRRAGKTLAKRFDQMQIPSRFESVIDEKLPGQVAPTPSNNLSVVHRLITTQGSFEIRVIHPQSTQLIASGNIPSDYEPRQHRERASDGGITSITYLVKKEPEQGLTGKYIQRAFVSRHPVTGQSELRIDLDLEGRKRFAAVTSQYKPAGNKHYQLAFLIDGEIAVDPPVLETVETGVIIISRAFSKREAAALACALENPLEVPLQILEEKEF